VRSILFTRLCEGEGSTDWVRSDPALSPGVKLLPPALLADDDREPGRPGRLYVSGMEVDPSGKR
jgi:hypothetical protein